MFREKRKQTKGSYLLSGFSLTGMNNLVRVIFLSVLALIFIQATALAQNVNLNGDWEGYDADGTKSAFVWHITETNKHLTFTDIGGGTNTVFNGRVTGSGKITDSNGKTGTFGPAGLKITWSDGVVWKKKAAAAKPTASPEQSCRNKLQDKVAWDAAGDKHWEDANLSILCSGTSNADTTVNCFRNKITSGMTYDRAIPACTTSSSKPGNPVPPDDNSQTITRTITIKNNSGLTISGVLVVSDDYSNANQGVEGSGTSAIGGSQSNSIDMGRTTTLGANISTPLSQTVELWLISEYGNFFRATLPQNKDVTSLCYNVAGTAFTQNVTACDSGQTYETKYILVKNQAGYNSVANLSYSPMDGTAASSAATKTMTAGYEKKIYLPLNADTNKQMTLKLTMTSAVGNRDVLTRTVNLNSFDASGATCYKAWGSIFSPKGDPCSTNGRKITFKNNGAYQAHMTVTYYDKDASGNDVPTTVNGNPLEVLESDSIEVPVTQSTKPITVSIKNNWGGNEFFTTSATANFTGELCYKSEGTTFSPNAAACDGTMGDTSGNTRQIRFQNDAGYDAKMLIFYWVDQKVNGTMIATLKTLDTGMINGLGGKFRLLTIPKKTSAGKPILVHLIGNATVKGSDDVYATQVPGDFAASPQQCFKTWGTLFNPSGGTCNQ